jgi:hypothetical protein
VGRASFRRQTSVRSFAGDPEHDVAFELLPDSAASTPDAMRTGAMRSSDTLHMLELAVDVIAQQAAEHLESVLQGERSCGAVAPRQQSVV